MDYIIKNKTLTIALEGRIDSNNSEAVAEEISNIIAENNFDNLVLDADLLEYISSAGLRIVLRLRKAHPSLKIINVPADVYEVFDMTGFTEMMPI